MSLRQTLIKITAAHFAFTKALFDEAETLRNQAQARYQAALELPEDEVTIEPVVEGQPDPVIEPQPQPVVEPVLPLRRVFDLTALNNWLAGQGYCVADSAWGLRVVGSDTPVFAPSTAGKIDWLFEHVFGAGQLQDLLWENPSALSLSAESLVEAIGIRHNGGSEYTEVLASA